MKALLVIDVQKGDFPPHKEKHDVPGLVTKINRLAEAFRKSGHQVVFIQHDGSKEGAFVPGTHGWELLDELEVKGVDNLVGKTANNSFYRSSLDAVLRENKISEVFITGSATDFCVGATVQGALSLDYITTVVGDAHTTGPRPGLTAEQVIAHYNWVWSELTPTKGHVKVLSTEEVLDGL